MKRIIFAALFICYSSSLMAAQEFNLESLDVPGEMASYSIMSATPVGSGNKIVFDNGIKEVQIVVEKKSTDPKKNLSNFKNISLSPDAKTIYFDSSAWATSDAIHSVNVKTHKERYVASGDLLCVIPSGNYKGNLIVIQDGFFVQGGRHSDIYMISPTGKKMGMVQEGEDSSEICPDPNRVFPGS